MNSKRDSYNAMHRVKEKVEKKKVKGKEDLAAASVVVGGGSSVGGLNVNAPSLELGGVGGEIGRAHV